MTSPAGDRRRRLRPALVLGALAAAVLLVVAGRLERSSWVDGETPGLRRTLAAIGPLDSPTLTAYRVLGGFDCLIYRRGERRLALEVCVDADGRVVETIDRRGAEPVIDSLRADPAASPVRVDRARVDALLRMMGAQCCR